MNNDTEEQSSFWGEEYLLIEQIQKLPIGIERDRLIDQLDSMPVKIYAFNHRWLLIHYPDPFYVCWSDEGYDADAYDAPEAVLGLAATKLVFADISNGGFSQCFVNYTGAMLPEVSKWCLDAGLENLGELIGKAMAMFGPTYPRSAEVREKTLVSWLRDWRREQVRPLDSLFTEFEKICPKEFEAACDAWLKQFCSIKKLKDKCANK